MDDDTTPLDSLIGGKDSTRNALAAARNGTPLVLCFIVNTANGWIITTFGIIQKYGSHHSELFGLSPHGHPVIFFKACINSRSRGSFGSPSRS